MKLYKAAAGFLFLITEIPATKVETAVGYEAALSTEIKFTDSPRVYQLVASRSEILAAADTSANVVEFKKKLREYPKASPVGM